MTYTISRWNLKDLYPNDEPATIEAGFKLLEKATKKVEAWRPKLKPGMSPKAFGQLLADYEAMLKQTWRLGGYASLRFSADTRDQNALALTARLDDVAAKLSNRTLFFSLWWKSLTEAQAARLMKNTGSNRYWLEEMRHFKPHTLSEPEEKVINLKNATGPSAIQTLYESFTNDLSFELNVDGEKKTLTRDALMQYVRRPEPEVRAAAYQSLYGVYGQHGPFLAQMYSALMRDWRTENVELRKFKSPIAVRNLVNDVPDRVVATLLKVIRENADVFQRYFRLKAKWIGMDRLRRYDIYAPLSKSDRQIDFGQGVQLVLDTFREFSPELADKAEAVFAAGHVDSEIRPGKRSGAFCSSQGPGSLPYVLLNYTGRVRDVATIAHELGHAVHAIMADGHTQMTFHASLPMAETASVFAEILLTEKLTARETDGAVRRDLLAGSIDDMYATVGRQGFFAIWEQEAHELVRQGATADAMAERYLAHLKWQFGDAVEVSEDFKWEWVSIPHFYATPFYVYAYSFGQLLVLGLYEQYKEQGASFIPKYLRLLSRGGSESPLTICREAGVNIASEKFWQGGFKVIRGLIDDLEALAA